MIRWDSGRGGSHRRARLALRALPKCYRRKELGEALDLGAVAGDTVCPAQRHAIGCWLPQAIQQLDHLASLTGPRHLHSWANASPSLKLYNSQTRFAWHVLARSLDCSVRTQPQQRIKRAVRVGLGATRTPFMLGAANTAVDAGRSIPAPTTPTRGKSFALPMITPLIPHEAASAGQMVHWATLRRRPRTIRSRPRTWLPLVPGTTASAGGAGQSVARFRRRLSGGAQGQR